MTADAGPARLTRGQTAVLAAATVPMVAFGALGAWGTYSNISSVFHRSATALGVVAAGEGATLVLALVLVGLTMLGQSSPAAVRLGLWALPALASTTGAAVAATAVERVVFAVTPLAMCVSAEGMGLLARRIVIHRTGVDMEAQRQNAATVQRLAYHRARAANHPSDWARKRSERASWRLARRVGVGDTELGAQLVTVQRARLTEGADAALAGMFGAAPAPAIAQSADSPRPAPEVVPAGARLLPIVARPEPAAQFPGDWEATTEVTLERADDDQQPTVFATNTAPAEVVAKPVPAIEFRPPVWSSQATTAAAEQPRQVVTETVTITPAELRRKALRLHRKVVASTGRPPTIDQLREEFGLSRREAIALRRELIEETP
jgi:hypothetical protein